MHLYTDLIAIDIGTDSIKMVSMDYGPGKQGYRVGNFQLEDIPEGLIGGGFTNPIISDLNSFKNSIQKMLKKLKSRKEGFIIGLPDRWVKMHLFEMDLNENEKQSPEYLSWRLEKNLPIPENMSVIVDFQILGKINDTPDSKYRVLAAAVKKDIVEILSSLTTELGMEVMAFDTSTLGVYNLFETLRPESCIDKTIIHCHVGHETTVVKAYGSGSLIYERVIEVGGEEFTHTLSTLDQLDFETATKIKEEEKFFPTERKDIPEMLAKRERIESIFGNWLRELNVTFRFFQEKFKTSKLPSIMITGGGAKFGGIAEFLSEYLDTDCFVFNPLAEIPLAGKLDKHVFESGPIAAPGIGLLVK